MQLKVFRGTLVHSRVLTEMEVLEDYLIGIDENNYGRVSCRNHIHTRRIRSEGSVLPYTTASIAARRSFVHGEAYSCHFVVRVNLSAVPSGHLGAFDIFVK